jgi:hypothetical protein
MLRSKWLELPWDIGTMGQNHLLVRYGGDRHSINVCIASRLRDYVQGCCHGGRVAKVTRRSE